MKILVIEDSDLLARSLKRGLESCGHAVDVVGDGKSGLAAARSLEYGVLVLDLMLPEMPGLTALRRLRESGCTTPVLILSARKVIDDRVVALRSGADDYLVKPFAFDELAARIEALGRRTARPRDAALEIGVIRIDLDARQVTCRGAALDLTASEYALLLHLASRPGVAVSRMELEDELYGEGALPKSNVVVATICSLRKRLAAHGEAELIRTLRGLGYVLVAATDA